MTKKELVKIDRVYGAVNLNLAAQDRRKSRMG
jgi:hypothetical protein